MSRKLKKIGIGLLVVMGSAGLSLLIARTVIGQKNEPLKPCLAEFEQAKKSYVRLAHVESSDIDYYLYSVGNMTKPGYWEPLIEVQSGVCRILNAKRDDSDHPLSEYVEPAIAKKIAIASIERKLKAMGGKEAFETMLAAEAKGKKKPVLIPTEEYEALRTLNVKMPSNVKPFDGVPNRKQLEEEHG
jgi:hypothetical protein